MAPNRVHVDAVWSPYTSFMLSRVPYGRRICRVMHLVNAPILASGKFYIYRIAWNYDAITGLIVKIDDWTVKVWNNPWNG